MMLPKFTAIVNLASIDKQINVLTRLPYPTLPFHEFLRFLSTVFPIFTGPTRFTAIVNVAFIDYPDQRQLQVSQPTASLASLASLVSLVSLASLVSVASLVSLVLVSTLAVPTLHSDPKLE
jgi:hypothetical protein